MTIPSKPINEIEKKTWVSDQDLILILDAESNEARLAPKEELRWEPGGKGENWEQWVGIAKITQKRDWKKVSVVIKKSDETESEFHLFDGDDGKNPEFQFSATHLQYRIQGEWNWKDLIPLSAIRWGTITNIKKTEGDGSPWTTDTYTITLSDGQTFNFFVYNGNDGKWSGDMLKANNLSDLTDKAQARENLWAEAKENKKTDIESNKGSNAFFPTIKAVYDWVINKLNWKADLVGGKVPASQLPEVSQIDESDLVHKSWDEVIGGNKTFNGTITSQYFNTKQDGKTNRINIRKEGELNRIDSFNDSSWFVDLNIRAKKLNFEWSSIVSNGQDWTGEWQSRTPTCGSSTITKHHCRYKVIGKTCYFLVEVYINNVQWETPWFTLPVIRKNYNTEFPIAGYCSKKWEHPAKESRWVLSFNGSNRIATLNSVDMWVLIQSWEYIVRASWCYEIE